jgi:trk system potassium uptake protein TrkA
MARHYAVIGLNAFGVAIARELTRSGAEVIAVDMDLERIERIKHEVALAIRLDATDPNVLTAHGLHQVDEVIITIGDDFEAIVLIAMDFMQLGAKRIMARAENATQKRILKAVGVSDILTPEEEVAKSVAQRLINPGIVDLMYTAGDHRIVEIRTPERCVGKTLRDLRFHERFHCHVVAIIQPGHEPESEDGVPATLLLPSPDTELGAEDSLIVLGLAKDIEQMTT